MTVFTRPVHKNLFFFEILKRLGRFKLHFDRLTNVRKDVLIKYRSFIKRQESPILQGRIHGTENSHFQGFRVQKNGILDAQLKNGDHFLSLTIPKNGGMVVLGKF